MSIFTKSLATKEVDTARRNLEAADADAARASNRAAEMQAVVARARETVEGQNRKLTDLAAGALSATEIVEQTNLILEERGRSAALCAQLEATLRDLTAQAANAKVKALRCEASWAVAASVMHEEIYTKALAEFVAQIQEPFQRLRVAAFRRQLYLSVGRRTEAGARAEAAAFANSQWRNVDGAIDAALGDETQDVFADAAAIMQASAVSHEERRLANELMQNPSGASDAAISAAICEHITRMAAPIAREQPQAIDRSQIQKIIRLTNEAHTQVVELEGTLRKLKWEQKQLEKNPATGYGYGGDGSFRAAEIPKLIDAAQEKLDRARDIAKRGDDQLDRFRQQNAAAA